MPRTSAAITVAIAAPMDLGEGPLWHAASGRFFCVDIHGRTIHAWNPVTGAHQQWATPERIGWLIPRRDGDGFMAGLQSGFYRLWLEPQLRLALVANPHAHNPAVRLNDAKADPWGHIWAGSMNNDTPQQPDGQLTRLDSNGSFEVVERGIHICNGPAIASNGQWMLHSDSLLDTTYRYDMTPEGKLVNKSVWRRFTGQEGTPDGMTIDADGNVWLAFWGGGCIRQFTPDGRLLRKIELPASQITSMAFGGPDLDTLLVTSARNGLSPEQLAKEPLAGHAFVLKPGVRGVLPCVFG